MIADVSLVITKNVFCFFVTKTALTVLEPVDARFFALISRHMLKQ